MHSRIIILLILWLLFSVATQLGIHSKLNTLERGGAEVFHNMVYSVHDPIMIDHSDNFTQLGFSGSGIESDPYLIDNLNITTDGICISVFNTSVYFEIRHCLLLSNSSRSGVGVLLDQVGNATIE
jgi:hypothetical protein